MQLSQKDRFEPVKKEDINHTLNYNLEDSILEAQTLFKLVITVAGNQTSHYSDAVTVSKHRDIKKGTVSKQ